MSSRREEAGLGGDFHCLCMKLLFTSEWRLAPVETSGLAAALYTQMPRIKLIRLRINDIRNYIIF